MVLVNGIFTDSVKANDRGLMYGDGVFRTLRVERGVPRYWDRHYLKLNSDCAALGITCPSAALLENELNLAAEKTPDCVAKIVVTRGPGERGFLPEAAAEPTRIILTSPMPDRVKHDEIRAYLCKLRLSRQPALAGIKHLNRLENILARMEWRDPDIAEGILLDAEGNVIEGTMSSLFLYRERGLVAPDLSFCGVGGVQRERVLEYAREKGIPVEIKPFGIDFLKQADEVFLVNSVIGLWQVVSLENASWQKGAFCEALRNWLQ